MAEAMYMKQEAVREIRPVVGRKAPAHLSQQQHPVVARKSLPEAPRVPPRGGKNKRPAAAAASSESVAKRSRKAQIDAAMVSPLPIVEFIQARVKPKACGYCELCRKPPCGKCRQCLLNIKGKTEKKRCAELSCERFLRAGGAPQAEAPQAEEGDDPLPTTFEDISAELTSNGEALAMISSKLSHASGHSEALKAKYKKLLARKSLLHSAQAALRNKKTHRKSPFPVGFPEIWNIIAKLEKARSKFADIVNTQGAAPASGGGKAEAIERKRQKRDTLDRTIAEYCQLWSEELAPTDSKDAEEFWKLVGKPRNIAFVSSSDEEEDGAMECEAPSPASASDSGSDSESSSFSDMDDI